MRRSLSLVALALCAHVHGQLGGSVGSVNGSGGGSLLNGLIGGLMGLEGLLDSDRPEVGRDIEPRLLGGIGLTFQWADVIDRAGKAKVSTGPGVGAMLELGGSFTYRERYTLSVSGYWGFNGYVLRLDTMLHSVIHSSKRAEARLHWHIPAGPRRLRQWHLGLAAGFTFQKADELSRTDGPFNAVTVAPTAVRPYFAPEFGGWTPLGKDRMELSLRYVIHADDAKAWNSHATMGDTRADFGATDNYFGVVTRYHIGFKNKKALRPPPPPPMIDLQERAMDTLATLSTSRSRIILRIWDDAEVDGDTVSILWNGQPVRTGVMLTKKPLRLSLDLHPGTNRLRVVAHNEGYIAPNTARCVVRRGKGREELLIKTSRKKDQLVLFTWE